MKNEQSITKARLTASSGLTGNQRIEPRKTDIECKFRMSWMNVDRWQTPTKKVCARGD